MQCYKGYLEKKIVTVKIPKIKALGSFVAKCNKLMAIIWKFHPQY